MTSPAENLAAAWLVLGAVPKDDSSTPGKYFREWIALYPDDEAFKTALRAAIDTVRQPVTQAERQEAAASWRMQTIGRLNGAWSLLEVTPYHDANTLDAAFVQKTSSATAAQDAGHLAELTEARRTLHSFARSHRLGAAGIDAVAIWKRPLVTELTDVYYNTGLSTHDSLPEIIGQLKNLRAQAKAANDTAANARIESASKILSNFHKNIPAAGRADVLKDVDRNVIVKRNADVLNAKEPKAAPIPSMRSEKMRLLFANTASKAVSTVAGIGVGAAASYLAGTPAFWPILAGGQSGELLHHLATRTDKSDTGRGLERRGMYLAMTGGVTLADFLSVNLLEQKTYWTVNWVEAMAGLGLARRASLVKAGVKPVDVNITLAGLGVVAALSTAFMIKHGIQTAYAGSGDFGTQALTSFNDFKTQSPNLALWSEIGVGAFAGLFLLGKVAKPLRGALSIASALPLVLVAVGALGVGTTFVGKYQQNPDLVAAGENMTGAVTKTVKTGVELGGKAAAAVKSLLPQVPGTAPATSADKPAEALKNKEFTKCSYSLVTPVDEADGGTIALRKGAEIEDGRLSLNNQGDQFYEGTILKNGKKIWVMVDTSDMEGKNCRPDPKAKPPKKAPRL